ncbi:MAG: serine hydrolase domain-containing protein [Cyclobacteriaceae bacterium]
MKQLLFAWALFASGSVYCQEFNRQKMDSLFTLIEDHQQGMGSISIFSDGQEVYQRAFGFASIEDKVKATPGTKYRIGSISKTFTAAIIMQLVEEGKLELDTRLSTYYPDIKYADEITIEQLLRHRSGIFNFTSAPDYPSWMEQSITQEELVRKIEQYGSVFEPDAKYEYSNANYVLLSYIVERIDQKSFREVLQERVCKPCALRNTYYGSAISVEDHEANSYTNFGDWKLATETHMSVPAGAGAIVANPTDLNKFLHCLFSATAVTEASLKQMTDLQDGYGLGMLQAPFYDKKAFGHTGGIDGFQSNAFYFPTEKVSVAYTSNGVVMPMNDILIGALSIYFGKDYDLADITPALKLKPEDLDQFLGVYSSPTFPVKLTITKNGNVLIGQGSGQPEFRLEAVTPTTFRFDPAQLEIEFFPNEARLILQQGGGTFELNKE